MGGGLKREEELVNFLSLKRKGAGLLERGGLFEWGAGLKRGIILCSVQTKVGSCIRRRVF